MRKMVMTFVVAGLLYSLPAAAQDGANSADLQDTLQMILQQQKTMQTQVNGLADKVQKQQETIDQQTALIDQQKKVIDEQSAALALQIEAFEQQKTQMATTTQELKELPGKSDGYSAELAYDTAFEIYETAIFDVPRHQQEPYFMRAVERFREVVENYPLSRKADEAQYRIALIYHRYLDDSTNAAKEWRYLLDHFPNSRYRSKAQEGLRSLGEKS